MRPLRPFLAALALLTLVAPFLARPAGADHAWPGVHWPRSGQRAHVIILDSATPAWNAAFATAMADWNADWNGNDSPVLATRKVYRAGKAARKACDFVNGKTRVCNAGYGKKGGWVGLTQVDTRHGHVVAARVKLNETYLGHAPLNNGAVRRHVLCHELGHVFGLDHPDGSARTCMNDLVPLEEIPDDARYQHPDQHDYDQLADIYDHQHSPAGAAAATGGTGGPVPNLEIEPVAGGPSVFQTDLGDGRRIVTFVHYVDDLTG